MYKVGDRVRVITRSLIDRSPISVPLMYKYCEEIVTISKARTIQFHGFDKNIYNIKEDFGRWNWDDECFERKNYQIKFI